MARMYALRIRTGYEDWHEFNGRIIERWSKTALLRIKARAWKIAGESK